MGTESQLLPLKRGIASDGRVLYRLCPAFGKAIVGYWSFVAIPLALVTFGGIFSQRGRMLEVCCLAAVVLNVLPAALWIFSRAGYYVAGLSIPGLLGGGIHVAFMIWSVINYKILSQAVAW